MVLGIEGSRDEEPVVRLRDEAVRRRNAFGDRSFYSGVVEALDRVLGERPAPYSPRRRLDLESMLDVITIAHRSTPGRPGDGPDSHPAAVAETLNWVLGRRSLPRARRTSISRHH